MPTSAASSPGSVARGGLAGRLLVLGRVGGGRWRVGGQVEAERRRPQQGEAVVDHRPAAGRVGRRPPGPVGQGDHADPGLQAAVGPAVVAGAVALVAGPPVAALGVELDAEAVAVAPALGEGDGRGQHLVAGARLQQRRVTGDQGAEEPAQVGGGAQGGARPGRRRHPRGWDQGPAVELEVAGGRPGLGAGGGDRLRGGHGARLEDVALDGLGIGAAGDLLQHQPEHGVADVGVAGPLAGRPPRRGLVEGEGLRDGRRGALHAADDPGGVGQQVPHADRPERGREGQPGQVVVDRGVQVDPPGVVLAQQRHGRHGLADRGHRHERARGQRPPRGDVADPDRELVPPPARPDQPHRQPGGAAPLPREPLQPSRRHRQRPRPAHPHPPAVSTAAPYAKGPRRHLPVGCRRP